MISLAFSTKVKLPIFSKFNKLKAKTRLRSR